jgi:hypothetical protein
MLVATRRSRAAPRYPAALVQEALDLGLVVIVADAGSDEGVEVTPAVARTPVGVTIVEISADNFGRR